MMVSSRRTKDTHELNVFLGVIRIELTNLWEKAAGDGAIAVEEDQGEAFMIAQVGQCAAHVADVFKLEPGNDLADWSLFGDADPASEAAAMIITSHVARCLIDRLPSRKSRPPLPSRL